MVQNGETMEKIRERKKAFRESEQKVADYVLTHPQEVIYLPITELAERIGVSEATIVRMCKTVGLRGFQELKINLARDTVRPIQTVHEGIVEDDGMGEIVEKVLAAIMGALDSTFNVLSVGELERAVEALSRARTIQFYGLGGSGPIAMDAAHKFMKTGKPVIAYNDSHLQAMRSALLAPDDVVVAISHSGSTKDIIEALEMAKEQGATTIGITQHKKSPIDRLLDIKLGTYAYETLYRMESTSSRIVQLAIIDALFIGVCLCDSEGAVKNIQATRNAIVPKRF